MSAERICNGIRNGLRRDLIPGCRECDVVLHDITRARAVRLFAVRPGSELPPFLRRGSRGKRDLRPLRVLRAFGHGRIVCRMLAERVADRVVRAARSKRENKSAGQKRDQKCPHNASLSHTFLLVFTKWNGTVYHIHIGFLHYSTVPPPAVNPGRIKSKNNSDFYREERPPRRKPQIFRA